MRICLISAATVTDFGESAVSKRVRDIAEHPPLGILTLGAILREHLATPLILDLNRIYYEYLAVAGARPAVDFCRWACSRVPAGFDVIGLSTICSSYPLTIRMAEQLKRDHPNAAVILGGPQASAVDTATLQAFPFIDLIVRGEADETLLQVLRTGVRSPALALVPGITFRSGRSVVRNPEGPVVLDLDALPFPAFDLLAEISPQTELPFFFPIEMGRGCPFACTFCSTNDFFRRRFRLKSPQAVLAQMARVRAEYQVNRFDLVHDMFTVDRKRVTAFCEAVLESGEQIEWGCSARTDCVDDELIELMYRAGCRSLFFGVETGSPRLQRAIEKDLDLEQAAARIKTCSSAGINTTVSLITGFPEETEEDMWQTVSFLLDAARYELVEPQLHVVAPLAGTPLHNRFRGRLLLDDVHSDMSHQGWTQEDSDRDLIASFPDIFSSFYGVPAPALDRSRLKRLRGFVLHALGPFRWVAVAVHQSRGGIRAFFEAWEEEFPPSARSGDEWARYYASADFGRHLAGFVRGRYMSGSEAGSLEALVQLAEGLSRVEPDTVHANDDPHSPPVPRQTAGRASAAEIVPMLGDGVRLLDVEADVSEIFKQLRRGDGLPLPSAHRVTLATRNGKGTGTDIVELTPLSASFLKLCVGQTLDEVAAGLKIDGELEALGREQVAALTFQELCRQRLLTWGLSSQAQSARQRLPSRRSTGKAVHQDPGGHRGSAAATR
jgi:radical SAM superfamily enzyme YgiQ (UPF0313 family)